MPPPLPVESDADSVADEIPHTKAEPAATAKMQDEGTDTKIKDDVEEEEEEEDDDEDVETYIVEAILGHRSDFEDGEMRYQVKWKGYDKVKDRTWQLEEDFEGARSILEEYWKSVGGKPTMTQPKSAKKRGRQSTGSKQPDSSKRSKTSKAGRKSNGALEQDTSPTPLIGYTDAGDDDWKPPPANAGSWDPLIQSVDTVIRENNDGDLYGYLIWNSKNNDGRFYRSKAKLPVIYRACPQRMLQFYEKHLVFSTAADPAIGADDQSAG